MLWSPPRRHVRSARPASLGARVPACGRDRRTRPVRAPANTVPDRWWGSPADTDEPRDLPPDEPTPTPTEPRALEEVVTVVAAPGLWTAVVAMAPAAPARGLVLVAGWLAIAGVLGRRRSPT